MSVSTYFSNSYAEAREKFLNACVQAGLPTTSYINPSAQGPSGEELYTDIVHIGPERADTVLVVISGTHGVEGFCGSGCQVGFLREGLYKEAPAETAIVLVHALNPYGFANARRVNEDNVDLNRNFIDHDQPQPTNAAYDEIHHLLIPSDWGGPGQARADQELARIIGQRGQKAIQAAITGGQYSHADGLFYGGSEPSWSNRMWRGIIREHLMAYRHVALVDLHSGLGRYGYGEPIFRGRFEGDGYARARRWYGEDVTSSEDGTSTSSQIMGNVASALDEEIGEAVLTAITLEFGTNPLPVVLNALRADHWLHARGERDSPLGDQIKAQILDAFYCNNDEWKLLVWERAVEILRRGLAGLRSS
jgi:hypothetical protein